MSRLKRSITGSGASLLSSLAAIVVGLLVGLIVLLISDASQALPAFGVILTSGFSNLKELGQVLYYATPLIMTGLSVGFANKTGLFNIGAPGQFIVGAYAAILMGNILSLGGVHWVVCLLAATLAGALWGSIPGLLKAYRNVNEVIACIMMNYTGMYLVNFLITKTVYDALKNQSKRVKPTANVPKMGLDRIFRDGDIVSSVGGGIIIAVLVGILIWIVLEKTKFGYELKACGYNRDAAKYAGINENRSIVMSMVIAGALAGLGGGLLYLAGSGKSIDVVDVLAAEGFNGIPVALLGMNNPIGIIFSALFVAYLNVGGFNMQLFGFAREVIEIIIAIIIYFSAFALLIKGFIQSSGSRQKHGEDDPVPIAAAEAVPIPESSQGKEDDQP